MFYIIYKIIIQNNILLEHIYILITKKLIVYFKFRYINILKKKIKFVLSQPLTEHPLNNIENSE